MNLFKFWQFYFHLPVLVRLLLTVLLTMFLFGITIHLIEPNHFPHIFDGIWWAFVTGSTVGYGDYVPLSTLGKVIAILLILTGGGLVTFYMATISASTINHENELSKGSITFKGKNHIIFVGWNERTKQLVKMITERDIREQIVLIDKTLSNLPYSKNTVHYIRGDASEDEVLEKANIKEAKYAIITSDPSKQERQADQTTILTTVAMKGNNPDLYIVSEILTKEQVTNATRAGANTVIRSNDFMSTLFFHELFRDTPVKPFDVLLEVLSSQQFEQLLLPNEMVGKTFLECSDHYVAKDFLLIGMINEEELKLNPSFDIKLKSGDILVGLSKLK
ncbi:potassium channel family protein [Aquibacillus koreensis]|uniref:Potassium channel family protein n=1 Tax=Aquibacillus koreensis TaxID=279446 RepID=A0A9X3WK20_9BACI|nr:potassium channel family protein [Aquibacillus koreensis]MCT2535857.1 potassium channel family protein [Aquibacillus koreensis]MDC3420313.1 potassium channel family protein [Aquibacillus koreensis]